MRLLFFLSLVGVALAFSSIRVTRRRTAQLGVPTKPVFRPNGLPAPLWSRLEDLEDFGKDDNGEQMVILAGDENDEFPEEMMADIEAGKPSQLMVMKQVN
jgi:hypothetical protein